MGMYRFFQQQRGEERLWNFSLLYLSNSFCESSLKPDGNIKIKEVLLSTSRNAISMLMDRCFLKEEIKDIKGVRRINRSFFFHCRIQHRNDQQRKAIQQKKEFIKSF